MARERTCLKCKETKPIHLFKSTTSRFMPGGRSIICTSCLSNMVHQDNLDEVDALCRWLDLPFDPNEWTKLYALNGDNTLTAYFELLSDDKYDTETWATENEKWRLAREQGTTEEEIEVLSKAEMSGLRKKWSEYYSVSELHFLEDYYNNICNTQNVNTPILQEYARDLCELELQIKKGVRSGEDVKKLMDARDNIIKIARFEANNSKNATDFDSVGELIIYCVKKGWHPEWKTEPKDSYDFLMKNISSYLQRLVHNEASFVEQVDDKKRRFDVTERLNNDEEDYEKAIEPEEYEGEIDLGDDEEDGV